MFSSLLAVMKNENVSEISTENLFDIKCLYQDKCYLFSHHKQRFELTKSLVNLLLVVLYFSPKISRFQAASHINIR